MDTDSKWYNPEYKKYNCTDCGQMYQFYVDGKCSTCMAPEQIKMAEKLAKTRNDERFSNIEFSNKHAIKKKSKQKKPR